MTGDLVALAAEVDAARGFDNSLDVRCEVALFEPNDLEEAIRPNMAGTKVIVTMRDGREPVFIARDFTISAVARKQTAAALRVRAQESGHG